MPTQYPFISRELANVFLRDINQRKNEGKESLEKYAKDLAEQIVKKETNLSYLLVELPKSFPINDEGAFLQGFGLCYDLFRRKIERENLEF